ncbi:MAG: UDP-N-acetylmuramoyl-L-alanine--D-glutamate ligase [Armatimonadetes bacterium]|nr:MAG: UDP-N-acetylmuramoyl-L-alanine--D-glutamate ligase [Armatimonadota bacterium]
MINDFKGKRVAVLGFGMEGISTVKFLSKHGADVIVLDRREEKEFDKSEIRNPKSLPALLRKALQAGETNPNDKNLNFKFGENYLENLDAYDVIVRSPGVKRSLPEILEAEKKGAIVTSLTRVFFDLCPCPIIGVTGTKGKGTTSSLIYEMLKAQGCDVYLGGNIGTPPLDFLDKLKSDSWVILELSSFQLQDLHKSPHIAVVLMITSEHLDYHKDVMEYVQAKRNILKFQTASDFAVINRDYLASNEADLETEGQIFKVSTERPVERGCFIQNNKVILKVQSSKFKVQSYPDEFHSCGIPNENYHRDSSKVKSFNNSGFSEDAKDVEIVDVEDILLPGRHNLENVCAGVVAAKLAGVEDKNIVQVLKTFKGLEHRLELVVEVEGVRYYDDSFSTTPETAIAAIEAFEEPEILIFGGSSKNSDFTHLGRVIRDSKNIKAIIGIGEEWSRMKREFQISNAKFQIIENCKSMKEVVLAASNAASAGDVVVLSPACASFDMFRNYKDRGDQFKEEVRRILNTTNKQITQ